MVCTGEMLWVLGDAKVIKSIDGFGFSASTASSGDKTPSCIQQHVTAEEAITSLQQRREPCTHVQGAVFKLYCRRMPWVA